MWTESALDTSACQSPPATFRRPEDAEPAAQRVASPWRPRRTRLLAVLALALAAVNLRPAVTSLGPVLEEARAALDMSATLAGLLTSVPPVCFALVGFIAPRLAQRWGPATVVAAGLAATALGAGLRPLTGAVLFVALSGLAAAGIAVVNVLLPAVVKQRFPQRVGPMTGLYTMVLNLGAAAAAAGTVPMAAAFGDDWRFGLGAWAALAAVAVPPWLALARDRAPAKADTAGPAPTSAVRVFRNPLAWALAGFFGLQAAAAYIVIGWLPQIFRDAGLSAETAGLLVATTSVLSVPLSFVLSTLAGRLRQQSGLVVAVGLFGLVAYVGLWAAPATAPWLWVVLIGVANCSFPLALTMIAMRGRDGETVARLSAFAQSAGYLLAAPGPILVGALYEYTGGWQASLAFLALLTVVQLLVGGFAGRDRQIG